MMHGDRKTMDFSPSLLGRTFRAVTLASTMLVSFAATIHIQTAAAASLKSGRYEAPNGAVIEVQGKSFYYTGKWNGEPVRRKSFVLELRPDATFMMARTVCSIGDQSISCTSPSGNETSYMIVTANKLPIQEKAANAPVNEPAAQPVNAEAAAKIAALELLLNKHTTDLTAMKDALKKTTQENQDLRLAVDKDAGTRTKEQEAAQKDLETKKLQLQSLTDELAALRNNANSLQSINADLQKTNDANMQQRAKEAELAKMELERANAKLNMLVSENGILQNQAKDIERERNGYQRSLNELKLENDGLKNAGAVTDAALAKLDAQSRELEAKNAQVKEYQSRASITQSQQRLLEEKVDAKENEISQLKRDLETARKTVYETASDTVKMREQNQRLLDESEQRSTQALAAQKNEMSVAQRKADDANREISRLRDIIKLNESKISQVEADNVKLKNEVVQATAAARDATQQIARAQEVAQVAQAALLLKIEEATKRQADTDLQLRRTQSALLAAVGTQANPSPIPSSLSPQNSNVGSTSSEPRALVAPTEVKAPLLPEKEALNASGPGSRNGTSSNVGSASTATNELSVKNLGEETQVSNTQDDDGYLPFEGPFRKKTVLQSYDGPSLVTIAEALLTRDQRGNLDLTITKDGKSYQKRLNSVAGEGCFIKPFFRYDKGLKAIVEYLPACGGNAQGAEPYFVVADVASGRLSTVGKGNPREWYRSWLNVKLLNMDGPDMQALYPREQSPYETFLISVGDPGQNPVAVALPNQENSFFSGKPSKMIFSDGGGALITVTGVFRGKGQTGEWSGSQNGTVYRLKTVKSKTSGEDQSGGNGQLQIGDAKSPIYNVSWCSGFCM